MAKLVSSAVERRECGRFVAEGLRLCTDAVLSGLVPEETYLTTDALSRYGEKLEPLLRCSRHIFEITDEAAARISDTKSTQGVFSLHKMLDNQYFWDKIVDKGFYVAADRIQDPSNLGAVCRTAEALGFHGLLVGGGCDIYNPRALRASMGAFFRLPVCAVDSLADILPEFRRRGLTLLATVPDADAVPITAFKKRAGVVCVIGNEGNGISEQTVALCDYSVTIPMRGRAESLNAAAAASIIMWELVRE